MVQIAITRSDTKSLHRVDSGLRLNLTVSPANRMTVILLAAAVIAWLAALPSVGGDAVSAWGLLASASPFFAVSIVLTVLGFVAATRANSAPLALTSAFVLAVVLRLTIAIGTSTAFYPWTYKHVAVTQYIAATGHVNQTVDIYNNWPGLFAATAWMSKLTGISPFGIAHWFTPCLHAGLVLGVYAFARQWGAVPKAAAAATFLYEGLNFVGQDYFSPQATSILLALGVLALLGKKLGGAESARHGYALVAALMFSAIVVTHQLTPLWLLVIIALLTLIRRCRPLWLLAYAAVASCGYLALHFSAVRYYGILSSDVVTNIQARVVGAPLSSVRASWYGTDVIYAVAFALSFILAVMALRRQNQSWAMWILAFTPIGLLLVQGYGGEAIWRVYLFALPALCFILAEALVGVLARGRALLLGMAALAAVLVLDSAQTTYVTWPSYRVSATEVDVVSKVLTEAPLDAFIAPLSIGSVNQLTATYIDRYNIDHNYGSSILGSAKLSYTFGSTAAYNRFDGYLAAQRKPNRPYYVVLGSRLNNYGWQYGQMKRGVLSELRKYMTADPRWHIVAQNSDAVAFQLVQSEG